MQWVARRRKEFGEDVKSCWEDPESFHTLAIASLIREGTAARRLIPEPAVTSRVIAPPPGCSPQKHFLKAPTVGRLRTSLANPVGKCLELFLARGMLLSIQKTIEASE